MAVTLLPMVALIRTLPEPMPLLVIAPTLLMVALGKGEGIGKGALVLEEDVAGAGDAAGRHSRCRRWGRWRISTSLTEAQGRR